MSAARTRARRLAMQGLYEWQLSGNDPRAVLLHLHETQELTNVDRDYLAELMLKTPDYVTQLDGLIGPLLSRVINEVDPVELAILRLAAYELQHRVDIPYRVVINEAIELAKKFGAEDGHKFVNGVLDKLAAQLRQTEIRSRTR
ncbi:MAG: transcription antitermination factor NusB [Gammaproteobacteria bacterium]|nr:transcription antitermination factor NusB [Gammaproteobacteria bacterium]